MLTIIKTYRANNTTGFVYILDGVKCSTFAKSEAALRAALGDPSKRTACLTGDTYPVREILKSRGWKWDASNKCWTMTDIWPSEASVVSHIRGYGGIRNRGNFFVTFA